MQEHRQYHGEERRHASHQYKGPERRKADAAAEDEEELMRQQEELRMQDQLNRPETD